MAQNIIHSLNAEACISHSTVAKEKNKTFRIECNNKLKVFKIHIDGCFIKGKQIRCDYAFIIPENNTYFFVELKSEDIEHAFNQIIETINHFNKIQRLDKNNIEGYIISSSVPTSANLKFQELIIKFKKFHGKSLARYTNQGIKTVK
ncbi:hypothetical protein [Hymenobacter sublimis]|uniref:Uncharacterized protein n=1 Tax=Hymenobacter sublimis TaxID=2933777 RepID=A0ABY4J5P4_9BACT|nr:hypothetical protein [Hymenobacter sublimis]UPL48160.1 hypothetical protein MWH26_13295 [Hymenobacter sublimis]